MAAASCRRRQLQKAFSLHPFGVAGTSSASAFPLNYGHCSRRPFSSGAAAATVSDDDDDSALTPFLLADIGEGIKEVELMQWFVGEGDAVRQFDRICEVQSDKATVEITSRYDGIVDRLSGNVGDMVQVGEPLLYLRGAHGGGGDPKAAGKAGGDGDKNSGTSSSILEDDVHPEPDQRLKIPTVASHYRLESDDDFHGGGDTGERAAAKGGDRGEDEIEKTLGAYRNNSKYLASPAVRKLGREYGLDLASIHPSGPRDRLLKSDVVTYLKEQGRWRGDVAKDAEFGDDDGSIKTAPSAVPTGPDDEVDTSETSASSSTSGEGDYEVVKLKGYHKVMAQTMTEALKIPHMCFADELVVNEIVKLRRLLKGQGNDINVSILAFLVKACSLALSEHPSLNALVHDAEACEIEIHRNHDIGIAVDTPRGLVVPVIRRVQEKSPLEIQSDLNDLKEKARDSKLSPEDLDRATFTLSNIGSIGGTYMQPVILPPQMAMGAFGKIQRLPRFVDADNSSKGGSGDTMEVVEAQVMHVSWAGDHRFLDGATLARFHAAFKRYVENPTQMLVNMK